jgi:hypothetical protein
MRTLVGEETEARVEADEHSEMASGLAGPLPSLIVAGIVAVGVALRFYSPSNLWLDEALSVNISRLSLGDLFEALRHDGHPPLYYVLLHYWMELFGEGDLAVRALSGIFGVAALPLAWVAGRRLAGVSGGRWALVVVALSPYAVRYSTETRMYSLVMLLVLAGYLLLTDALREPTPLRLAAIALITGALLLSHYWAFWLIAAVGVMLVWRWRHAPERRAAITRVILSLGAGGLLFLPWLPGFLYQSSHTGTPWADPVRPAAILDMSLQDFGGGEFHEGRLAGFALFLMCLLGLFVVRSAGNEMVVDVRTAPTVRREMALVAITAGIGWAAAYATGATFQSRYAAVIAPFVFLAAAVGLTVIPGRAQLIAGLGFVGLAMAGIVWVEYYERIQSEPAAAAIAERAQPGDVVVFCPDQLGPGYSRELPDDLVQLVYPTLGSPDRVDWVDYADRNHASDPEEIAAQLRGDYAGRGLFVVWLSEYRTFDQKCEQFIQAVGEGQSENILLGNETRYYEPANVEWVHSLEPL